MSTSSSKGSKVHVVNFSSYTTPVIKEVQGKDYIEYGEDNNYFGYLIDRYNGSPTNNAILNSLMDMTFGKGLDATDSASKPSEYAAMRGLFTKPCLQKIVADYVMMGQCAFQVVYSADHNMIVEVQHIPIETLRAARTNDEGDIDAYYYAKNWTDVASRKETPVRIPAFGASKEGLEILYIKPYRAGFYAYSPVDYQGSLPYSELEEEIANYHINNVQNSLSPSLLINFNNGVPSEEERRQIENQIAQKYSGSSNSGKFILAFNDNKDLAATIDTVQLSDAAAQYQFLSDEAAQKIMVSHRIVSPMLLGIKDNSGLGNNADELKTASMLLDNLVIRPKQEIILDGIDQILAYNDISLNLYFKTLQPLEFTETEVQDAEVIEESTGVKTEDIETVQVSEANEDLIKKDASYNGAQIASSLQIMQSVKDGVLTVDQAITFLVQMLQFDPDVAKALFAGNSSAIISQMKAQKKVKFAKNDDRPFLRDELAAELLLNIESLGESEEELMKDFDLITAELVEDEGAEYDVEAYLNSRTDLAAQQESEQDTERYKVRYFYAIGTKKDPEGESRLLCRTLIGAKRVYRKEDVEALSSKGGAEAQGERYSVWLFKGGANCHHRWERRIYRKKLTKEGKIYGGGSLNGTDIINVNQAIRMGFRPMQNDPLVAIAPIETPTRGYKN
jgi:hypothetical protein